LFPGNGANGCIVSAETQRWDKHSHPTAISKRLKFTPQQTIGGNTPTYHNHPTARATDGQFDLGDKGIDCRLLKRGCQIGPLLLAQLPLDRARRPHLIPNGRL
jgi:hypothetical protein